MSNVQEHIVITINNHVDGVVGKCAEIVGALKSIGYIAANNCKNSALSLH